MLQTLTADKNLFGAALEPDIVPAGPVAAPVEPPSKLLLMGVMMGGVRSSAIIRNVATDTVAVVALGGWVFGRTESLARVERDAVVLVGPYGRRRLQVGVLPQDQPALIETSRPPAAPPAGNPGINVSRAEINASVQSPEQLIGESKLVPEVRNGKIVGVRVTVVADNSIVKKMGMEANDIIKALNGQQLDSLERSTQIWEAAKKASEIHMVVERNGQDRNMDYYLRP